MKDFEVEYEGNHIVAYNKLLFKTFPQNLFDPAYLQTSGLLTKSNDGNFQGRGRVQFFEYAGVELVLRHYHRGGLPAKISNDHYFWTGFNNTRAIREIDLLAALRLKHLPVPVPAAAHIFKSGLKYQADIITGQILDSRTLGEVLLTRSLNDHSWRNIGQVIKQFHNQNCNHVDLNANNIMIDQDDQIYLIDFDRSKIETSSASWQEKNLQRLQHSLEKLNKINDGFHYANESFNTLMQGYRSS